MLYPRGRRRHSRLYVHRGETERLDRKNGLDTLTDLEQSARGRSHERTDFDLRKIRKEHMSIYIGVAPGDIARVAPLLRLFFDAC